IYGFCIISFIDNIMKPKLIGDRAKIHPLIIFFGIAGGLAFFGFTGIFIGPIILAVFSTLVDIYRKEYLDVN
ncbi:MAG: AI-2E family transporter, partial [Candidatus Woesearchaeota archaeon]|nr:AI-2E family transporter [Candidatus Woesearchaeota archaeon]